MTITLQLTQRMIPALLLVLGLMIQTSTAHAQSRGRTTGRQSKTESAEKKASPPAKQKSSSKESSRSSSRQRASGSSSRGGSSNARQQSGRSSGNSKASSSSSRRPANPPAKKRAESPSRQQSSGRATTNRSSRSGNSSGASKSSEQNAGRSSANRSSRSGNNSSASGSRQQNSGRSTANGGSRSGNNADATRQQNTGRSSANRGSRSGNNADATRQQNAGRSSANRGSRSGNNASRGSSTREPSSGRSASSGRNSSTNQRTRGVNNGSRQSSGRGTVNNQNTRVNGRRNSARRDATGVRVVPAQRYGWRDSRKHNVYKDRHWRYKSNRVYVNPVYHHRPHVQVNVVWPWQNRYRREWRPSYRYSQVVYVESGYRGNYRRAKVDIRTNYHHEVRYADQNKAVVDIYLDEIEVYEDGYFLGKVRRFPRDLEHIEATIYRNGEVVYDRDVFIVGNPRVGFEMISTRSYDGYVLDKYDRSHGMEVGRLNFKRKRVDGRRYSRLFDPYDYNGYAPISVLPDDEQLLDYGYDAISYHHYDDNYDPYYGGSYNDSYYDYDNTGGHSVFNAPRRSTHGASQLAVEGFVTQAQPLTLNRTHEYQTRQGVAIKLEREATLERIK